MGKTQAASEPAASDRPRRHAHRHSGSANRAHFVRTRPFEFHSVCCSQQRYCYNIVRAIPGLFIITDAHESWITDGSWGLWPFLLLARRATESACGVVNYRTKNRVLPLAAEHLLRRLMVWYPPSWWAIARRRCNFGFMFSSLESSHEAPLNPSVT